MAIISKPNKYPTIYEFNYKPRSYELQKYILKSYEKREILRYGKGVKESTFPSTNHGQRPNGELNCFRQ